MGLPVTAGAASGLEPAGLEEAFAGAWARADSLLAAMRHEALLACPVPELPTPLYYVGAPAALTVGRIPAAAAVGWPHALSRFAERGAANFRREGTRALAADWPSLNETLAMRDAAREFVMAALVENSGAPAGAESLWGLYRLLEEELLLQERWLALLRHLDPALRHEAPPGQSPSFAPSGPGRRLGLPPGQARVGVDPVQCTWAAAHERPARRVSVPAFTISTLPVMVGEFFEFVLAGGYDKSEHWRPEDWGWIGRARRRHPVAWTRRSGEWLWRGPFQEQPLTRVFDWPASVSMAEARAYASWRGARLPTEAEWCWAAHGSFGGLWRTHPWGESPITPRRARHAEPWTGPGPVGALPAGSSAFGVHELVGNGWEWVSGDDSDEAVLRGLSWASDPHLARPGLRLRTSPHDPWRFTKFRLVHPTPS